MNYTNKAGEYYMAYIPDFAVRNSHQISPMALRLYQYYCMRRNRNMGGYYCPKSLVLADLVGMSGPSYFRAKQELKNKKWIVCDGDFIRPLVGFETLNSDSQTLNSESETIKSESDSTIKNDSQTISIDSQTLNSESETIKNESVYKEYQPLPTITKHNHFENEPSSSISISSQFGEPTHRQNPLHRPAPQASESEVRTWLDAVAQLLGAPDRHGLPKVKQWRQICEQAIRSDFAITALLSAVKAERDQCRDNPQYFTPDKCLQRMQFAARTSGNGGSTALDDYVNPLTGRRLNEFSR